MALLDRNIVDLANAVGQATSRVESLREVVVDFRRESKEKLHEIQLELAQKVSTSACTEHQNGILKAIRRTVAENVADAVEDLTPPPVDIEKMPVLQRPVVALIKTHWVSLVKGAAWVLFMVFTLGTVWSQRSATVDDVLRATAEQRRQLLAEVKRQLDTVLDPGAASAPPVVIPDPVAPPPDASIYRRPSRRQR